MPKATTEVTPHVHVIPANGRAGVPNVGIVVGTRAVLVVDSGLGVSNGRLVADVVHKIAPGRHVYVIATHWHVEHLGGEGGFPVNATILRPLSQQREVDGEGARMIETFRSMSADNRALLEDFAFRPPDVTFDGGAVIHLGGVRAEIIAAGPAHTDGDIAVLVRQDGVLFSGDVVQQDYTPVLSGQHASVASWLEAVARLEALPAAIIVPSHSALSDRRSFADMRAMLTFLRDRWSVISAAEADRSKAVDRLIADFRSRFPGCLNADLLAITAAHL